jgi:hypothetical protein
LPHAEGGIEPLPKPRRPGSLARMSDNRDDDDGGGNRRGALIGLAVTAMLVVAAYFLFNSLRNEGKMEDCLMSGRSNCAPLDIPTHK